MKYILQVKFQENMSNDQQTIKLGILTAIYLLHCKRMFRWNHIRRYSTKYLKDIHISVLLK